MASLPLWLGRRPLPLTALVGRDRELAAIRDLVLDRETRLVTLTGPGGVGKTRLAVAVASSLSEQFDAVAFVPLAPVRDPALVMAAIAQTVGVQWSDPTNVEALRAFLNSGRMMLILDNLEHLLAAGPELADTLAAASDLTLLVTSRALLRVSGEHVLRVVPLALPEPGPAQPAKDLAGFGAVRLFIERGAAVQLDFTIDDDNADDIVEICRRLDGLPLAIELAAARLTVLTPRALLVRLGSRLPLLTGGARDQPERLRTMRAAIAWSHDLLPPDEQRLFRRLAVFDGTCSLSAVAAVVPESSSGVLDVVGGLVDKSLLQYVSTGDEPRFAMLDTVREYAMELLVAHGEEIRARRSHLAHFVDLTQRSSSALRGRDQQEWRDALETDLDNVRGALAWALGESADPRDAEQGLLLVGALWYFWFQRGFTGEARRWLAQALGRTDSSGHPRAQALLGAGTLAWRQGECAVAREYLEQSATMWREDEDQVGLAETMHVLGHVQFDQGDFVGARRLFEESLQRFRRANDEIGSLPLIGDLGMVAYHESDFVTADRVFRECLELYRARGLKDRVAGTLNSLGDLARVAGDITGAASRYEESLALWRDLRGTPGIASALHKLGQISRANGDNLRARERYVESLTLQQELGNRQGIGECLAGLAATTASSGELEHAAQLYGASATLLESIGVPLAPVDQMTLIRDMESARRRLGEDAWSAAWAAGSALPPEQAVNLARLGANGDEAPPRRESITLDLQHGWDRLSRREREVIHLLAEGLTNREIAGTLMITERTVGSHIEHIMTKLGTHSRTRVAVWAAQQANHFRAAE